MKLMQKGYNEIQSVEIELRILDQASAPPSRPREYFENNNSTVVVEKNQSLDPPPIIRIKKVRFIDET